MPRQSLIDTTGALHHIIAPGKKTSADGRGDVPTEDQPDGSEEGAFIGGRGLQAKELRTRLGESEIE